MLNFLEMFLGAILGNALYPYIRDAIKKRWGKKPDSFVWVCPHPASGLKYESENRAIVENLGAGHMRGHVTQRKMIDDSPKIS
jgi:hypothetical protein